MYKKRMTDYDLAQRRFCQAGGKGLLIHYKDGRIVDGTGKLIKPADKEQNTGKKG